MYPEETFRVAVSLRCACGNSDAHEGFYSCDFDGHPVRGGSFLCCERCGVIFDAAGAVAGHRSFVLPEPAE